MAAHMSAEAPSVWLVDDDASDLLDPGTGAAHGGMARVLSKQPSRLTR